MRNLIFVTVLALAFGQPAIAQTALEKMQQKTQKADQQKARDKKAQRKASPMEKKKREICNRQANEKKLRGDDRRRFVESCVKG
jgi:hypothetical protein